MHSVFSCSWMNFFSWKVTCYSANFVGIWSDSILVKIVRIIIEYGYIDIAHNVHSIIRLIHFDWKTVVLCAMLVVVSEVQFTWSYLYFVICSHDSENAVGPERRHLHGGNFLNTLIYSTFRTRPDVLEFVKQINAWHSYCVVWMFKYMKCRIRIKQFASIIAISSVLLIRILRDYGQREYLWI